MYKYDSALQQLDIYDVPAGAAGTDAAAGLAGVVVDGVVVAGDDDDDGTGTPTAARKTTSLAVESTVAMAKRDQ